LGVLLGVVVGGILLAPLLAMDVEISGALVGALVGIGIYAAVFTTSWFFALLRRNASFRDAWFRKVNLGVLLMMLPLSVGVLLLNGAVLLLTRLAIGDVPTADEMLLGEDAGVLTGDAMIALFVFGAVAAPIVEEFFFRGLLYQYLRTRRGVLFAAVLSSLAFALAHLTPRLIPPLFVMGLVLAWLVERYKSVYPAVAVHALNNGVVLLIVFAVAA
jgi:uncharacterized protein